jgi:hypothetical protein
VAGPTACHDRFSDERVVGADPGPGGSSGNSANPLHDFLFKQVFLETGCFNREKTVQFSRVPLSVKNRLIIKVFRDFGQVRRALRPKNKGGSLPGKIDPVFLKKRPVIRIHTHHMLEKGTSRRWGPVFLRGFTLSER